MSDDKNLGDDLDDMLDDDKKGTNKFSEDTKRSAHEFSEGAKRTANEFSQGARETFNNTPGDNKKLLAGILAILLGPFGIHKFILGYNKEGIILLVITLVVIPIITLVTCGIGSFLFPIVYIIPLIEGIIYLTKTDEEFYATYQVGRKPWF